MAAYLIVDLDIHDRDGFAAYRSCVGEFIAKHGGEYLVRGGEFEVHEGDFRPHRLVLFRFPDRQAIRNLLADPDYEKLAAIRRKTANTISIAVDGAG
jgi:uncharacterized protein (DUF1330 family)